MLDVPVIEQVIAVPKIFLTGSPSVLPFVVRRSRTVGGSADGPRIFTGSHCRAGHWVERCNGTGGADRGQSSSSDSAGGWRRSSRFSSRTGFSSSGHGADR